MHWCLFKVILMLLKLQRDEQHRTEIRKLSSTRNLEGYTHMISVLGNKL